MLPLSHAYVSTKVTGRKSPLLVFGSVLPDIASTSKQEISREEIHNSPKKFYDFVKTNFPDLVDLAVGVRLHSDVGKGADFYSDDNDTGFAKIEGRKIMADIKKLLDTDDEKIALSLAHSFIEAGVDLNLSDSHPEMRELFSDCMRELDLNRVNDCLSNFLAIDTKVVLKELKFFKTFLNPERLSSAERMIDGIVSLIEMRFGKTVESTLTLQILLGAKELTKDSYLNYLDEAVAKIKNVFQN